MNKQKLEPKILPNSFEAEQALLCCVLLDQEVAFDVMSSFRAEDFYNQAHQTIFSVMKEIYTASTVIDFVTVTNMLEKKNILEQVGGIEYISNLTNFLPSATNVRHYSEIVKNASKQRSLIKASQEIIDMCHDTTDGNKALQFAEKKIFDISQENDISDLKHIGPAIKPVLEKFEKLANDSTIVQGVASGFKDLDAITNGFQRSDLIILAARPGVGKTTLAMNFINNAAINYGKSCAVFSFEMPVSQLVQRSLCSVGCVNMESALHGTLTDRDWNSLWLANKKLSNAKIFIDDNSGNTTMDIRSKCLRLKREHGLDLVMIDYLGLIQSGFEDRYMNKVHVIGKITTSLKHIAKELDVPIILLSQLSRNVESREKNHKPMLADLRDSGAIEQDADIVMFIYNPDKYADVTNEDGEGVIQLEIAKHRNGKTGTVKLKWISEWLRFAELDFHYEKPQVQDANQPLEEVMETQQLKKIFEQKEEEPK